MDINKFIKEHLDTPTDVIAELQNGRPNGAPDADMYKKDIDVLLHNVNDRTVRKDKLIKVDDQAMADAQQVTGGGEPQARYRTEPVARIALALQKLITKRAVAFAFGNEPAMYADTDDEQQMNVLQTVKKVLSATKTKSVNRAVANDVFSATEAAELWYVEDKPNTLYGFESNSKLRVQILSPLNGDTLYPYFNEFGDMTAFSRTFTRTDTNKRKIQYFEAYTDELILLYEQKESGEMELAGGYPKTNALGKIPVIYAAQSAVEWADVQNLIDRLEKLLSNFADTNDYHASPKIFVTGQIEGWAKKGESGAVIQGEEGATAQYLSWAQAPESVRLEIETLLRMIYTITQTPDISFDTMRTIGAVSGTALRLLFIDAHLKVQEKAAIFEAYLQRRVNVILAFLKLMNARDAEFVKAANDIVVECELQPYMVDDLTTKVNTLMAATGQKAIMSRKTAVNELNFVNNTEEELAQIESEEAGGQMADIFEPTE